MQDVIEELKRMTSESYDQLTTFSDAEATAPLSTGKWSRKELMGHLIDSASNSHQRFIRAQLVESHSFPTYTQDNWVALQGYNDEAWEDLTLLWKIYNRHLAHVISRIPEDKLCASCTLGNGEPVTLQFIVEDYVKHLRHHLDQILGER